nr:hypothetical protein [Lactococcus lactis]
MYEEWVVIRKQDVKPASFVAEQISLRGFIEKFSKYKVSEVTTADIQSYSHVSLLVELGVPIKAIMERVGYRDESITLRIYSHISGTIKNEISQKLNQINL